MAKEQHKFAWELVEQAVIRFAREETRDGDHLLIVMGAILEEVSNGKKSFMRRPETSFIGVIVFMAAVGATLRYFGV